MSRPGRLTRHPPLTLAVPLVLGALLLAARWLRRGAAPGPATLANRSRSIIHSARDAIITTDDTQTILQVNPAAAQMFGTSVAAMHGQALERYIPRDLRSMGEQPTVGNFGDTGISLRMVGRRATDYAVTGQKADGQQFPLEGSISSLAEDGAQIYTIILRDITARKQVQEQLEQSYSQLRKLSAALQTIREEERTHIARELHDDLGQLLATLRMDLSRLQQQDLPAPASQRVLRDMDTLIVTAIASLRRIASNLRPRALDEGGLYYALHSLRHEFMLRYPVHFELLADEADLALDDDYSTAIFRIVQEALTNITRHAQASTITISLYRIDSKLGISIQDDGRGIAESDMNKTASLGLLGMRERVWALHGEISIGPNGQHGEPRRGAEPAAPGTRIDIALPLPPHGAASAPA